MTCLYGDPGRQTTILKRCDMQRDAVLVAAASHTASGSSSGWIESRAQGGGPARSGEFRARPTIRAAEMVSEMKAVAVHRRREDGSLALRLGPRRRLKTYSRLVAVECL